MTTKTIKMEQMEALRDLSRQVADQLTNDISGYTRTLTTLFSPRRVLGEFMAGSGKDKVIGADKNYSAIEERYKTIMRDGFGLSAKLSSIVPMISNKVTLINWQYIDNVDGMDITFKSPVKWVLGYETSLTIERLLASKLSGKSLTQDEISNFVITKLVVERLLENNPSLVNLFKGLGYSIESRTLPGYSGDLTYMLLVAPVESFRPQNEIVKMAAQFSGNSEFTELIDEEAIDNIENTQQKTLQDFL